MALQFWRKKMLENEKPEDFSEPKVKVAIAPFVDNCPENTGKIVEKALRQFSFLDVQFYGETTPKSFLSMQEGGFFDLIDTGEVILKKTGADIVIWGYRGGAKIRLNFQRKDHYGNCYLPFFSLLDSLYLPFSYFQQQTLPSSILLLMAGAILALSDGYIMHDNFNKIIEQISRSTTPSGLSATEMPYILNLLAAVYLQNRYRHLSADDINLILQLVRKGVQVSKNQQDFVCMGCLYSKAGQLYALMADLPEQNKFKCQSKAVECFRYARKYLTRYKYPYDFGFQAYFLSEQYFEFWKQTNDIQALRDAVFHLREAEKIFTMISFPRFWAEIQGALGYYLSLLGTFGKNDEILMLAVDNYKNKQRIYTKYEEPLEWVKCEESIGNILYSIGKMHDNIEYLSEAIKYFSSAADFYEEQKISGALRQMEICRLKSEECILRLREK